MKDKYLLYGSNGYTGKLIIEESLKKNIKPILAGRNAQQLAALAEKYHLEYRVFTLDKINKIEENLHDIKVVMHAAGPFVHTAPPMVEACLTTQTHYLDITGEVQVFEHCAALDAKAKKSGIMILPGTGFDVVPSDCLALYLKKKMPEATQLSLAFAGMNSGLSRGTSKTMIENMGGGGLI
nr:saccharopine dehydrogenase NADP-binding domain-containing protein [Bacteroidota bacterium]